MVDFDSEIGVADFLAPAIRGKPPILRKRFVKEIEHRVREFLRHAGNVGLARIGRVVNEDVDHVRHCFPFGIVFKVGKSGNAPAVRLPTSASNSSPH